MTRDAVINMVARLYDEYLPNVGVDEDLKTFLSSFLDEQVENFIQIIPAEHIASLVIFKPNSVVTDINYKGGSITLPVDFGTLISFRFAEWTTKLGKADLINEQNPIRKRQENKFTAGSISRPVISLEYTNGVRTLCFWGWKTNKDAGNELHYIKKCVGLDSILSISDWLLNAYCYYVLYNVLITTKEIDLAKVMQQKTQEILLTHNITPSQPIFLGQDKK